MLEEQAAENTNENAAQPEPVEIIKQPDQAEAVEKIVEEKVEETATEPLEAVKEPVAVPAAEEIIEEVTPEAETPALPEKTEEVKGEPKWYVIQTYSGQEEKVKASIEKGIEKGGMQKKILQILVPTEETVEIKGNKRLEKVRKMFPGYVFVEMVLDDESWYAIRQTPGVSRFIGSKTAPTPVMDREMQRVLKQLGVKQEKLEITFEIGEAVRVISGPFRGYTGSVNEINPDKGKLKVLINIFGRDTPVEVNFEHAEKVV